MTLRVSSKRISSVKALQDAGFLPSDDEALEDVAKSYAIGVSDQAVSVIGAGENDVVARQFIPSVEELRTLPQEEFDPIGDEAYTPVKGIVHRYPDRVLLKATSVCAVYCRYCFRREMVGQGERPLSAEELENALRYIRSNRDIREVILTGGDPLVLSVRQLEPLLKNLNSIDHLDIVRIHSRVPVSDPVRITDALCGLIKEMSKAVYIAVHVNHGQEINEDVRAAIAKLDESGAVLVSQSVMLKGVNDDPAVLEALYRELLRLRVKPYYLHHPDLARGTSHFRFSLSEGMAIHRQLLGRLSGLAQPHYMLDIPGGAGKVPIHSGYVEDLGGGRYSITDYQGQKHLYEDPLA